MKVRIYTDGACSGNPGPGGWGTIALFEDTSFELSGYERETTNNRMELKAVIVAFQLADKLDRVKYKDIEICSDSAYVINAIEKLWLPKWVNNGWETTTGKDVKNKDLWQKLLKYTKDTKVKLVKVKGHSGDVWNDKCDKLAKNAIVK